MSMDEDKIEETLEILSRLPEYYDTYKHNPNYNLLAAVGAQSDIARSDTDSVRKASSVYTAESTDDIRELSKLVGLGACCTDESLEKYRARTIAEFQLTTGTGTISDLLNLTSLLLGVSTTQIQYSESPGMIVLSIPSAALDAADFTVTDTIELLSANTAAGFQIGTGTIGSLRYITPAQYDAGEFESGTGYDGLDETGNPLGEGGTYQGLLL